MKYNKNKKVSRRARVDPTVDRNEFIRLRRTEDFKAPGASGAPADAEEILYIGGEIVNRHMEIVDLFFWRSPKVWFWFWALFYDLDTIWVLFGFLGLGALFLVQKGGPKRTTCRYTI